MAKKKNSFYRPNNFILVLAVAFVLLVAVGLFFKNCGSWSASKGTSIISQGTQVKSLVTYVDEAASYLEKNGEEKAFEEFRKEGKWRKGETYLFVYNMQGVTLLLPPQANLEGTNRLTAKDIKGKYFVKEMLEYSKSHASGWLGYYYIKPGNDTQFMKLSYFKKVRVSGKEMIIGSGVYLE